MRAGATAIAAGLVAIAQIGFAVAARHVTPNRDLLPPVPTPRLRDAESFGDPQFLFRIDSLEIQNAGDTGGRIVPVKNYDFGIVVGWLRTLQSLDSRSAIPIELASGYFGQSQNTDYVRPIVEFMRENVGLRPQARWKYLFQAVYLAQRRLRDNDLALATAYQLASYDFPDMMPLAGMMPAFILEDLGRFREARAIIEKAQQRFAGRLSPDDDKFIHNYLDYLATRE
jgi:hypothetical protein